MAIFNFYTKAIALQIDTHDMYIVLRLSHVMSFYFMSPVLNMQILWLTNA